jgi:hypothetical protein
MPRLLIACIAALLLGWASPAVAGPKRTLLQVKSVPTGAAVWVNGEPAGFAPVLLPLSGGRHTVSVALAGHAVETQDVVLKRGKRKTLTARLTAAPVVTPDARLAVQQILLERGGRLREWRGIHTLPFDLIAGAGLLGGFGASGLGDYVPELGLYLDVDTLFTGSGVTVLADFFEDEAQTLPAGEMLIGVSLLTGWAEVEY